MLIVLALMLVPQHAKDKKDLIRLSDLLLKSLEAFDCEEIHRVLELSEEIPKEVYDLVNNLHLYDPSMHLLRLINVKMHTSKLVRVMNDTTNVFEERRGLQALMKSLRKAKGIEELEDNIRNLQKEADGSHRRVLVSKIFFVTDRIS